MGRAYVHVIMHGELMEVLTANTVEEEVFYLV
jgi:hypothetical protein